VSAGDGARREVSRPRRTARSRVRTVRWPFVVLSAVAIGALALASGSLQPMPAPSASPLLLSGFPAAAPSGADASEWWCAAPLGGSSSATIVVANPTSRETTAEVTVLPGERSNVAASAHPPTPSAPARPETLVVGPLSSAATPPLVAPKGSTWAGVEVSVAGGGVGVEELLSTAAGQAEAPCESVLSRRWYVVGGTTAGGFQEELELMNPTSAPAVVDVEALDLHGALAPEPLQGLVVPARAVVGVDLGHQEVGQAGVGAAVTVRSGRLVVESLVSRTGAGSAQPALASIGLGMPTLERSWVVPDATAAPGGTERIAILDPTGTPAKVDVALALGRGSVSPFKVEAAAGQVTELTTTGQPRVPTTVPYGVVVTSTNGVPVDVVRTYSSPTDREIDQAVPVGALGWVVPVSALSGVSEGTLALFDAGSAPATLRLRAMAGGKVLEQRTGLVVQPRHQLLVPLTGELEAPGALFDLSVTKGPAVDVEVAIANLVVAGHVGNPGIAELPVPPDS
jgi:hypothetical protein